MPATIRGQYFYLYLFMDVFSRKIVGWQVYAEESSAQASEVLKDLCARETIQPNRVILHSDNGGPMKGATMLATLQALGVMPSLSRPGVSNDNPLYVAAKDMSPGAQNASIRRRSWRAGGTYFLEDFG